MALERVTWDTDCLGMIMLDDWVDGHDYVGRSNVWGTWICEAFG